MLTPDLTPFEESFYFYQRRLNQRLALPLTRYFYFKKGMPADLEWKRKQRALGDVYTGFGKRAWADELLVGDNSHMSPDNGFHRLAATTVSGEDATGDGVQKFGIPLPRRSKADEEGNRRSLDRAMTRTLYLLVKKKGRDKHVWRFPQCPLVGRENLKEVGHPSRGKSARHCKVLGANTKGGGGDQAAERTLAEAAGVNMNTWFVGNVPIGHNIYRYPGDYNEDGDFIGKKVFFMKARIMAGQADLAANKHGLEDFMWLTKEEIEEVAGLSYFNVVKNMLVSQ